MNKHNQALRTERLRRARKLLKVLAEEKISRAELARRMGISSARMSQILNTP